jgi:hypothetical protein
MVGLFQESKALHATIGGIPSGLAAVVLLIEGCLWHDSWLFKAITCVGLAWQNLFR